MEELDISVALLTAAVIVVPALISFAWGYFVSYSKTSTNTIDDKVVELVEKLNLISKAQEKVTEVLNKKLEEKKAKE